LKKLPDYKMDKISYFENCFIFEIDRKPIDFIIDKVNAGSDFDSILYLYNIITEQIQNNYDIEIVPMIKYYDEAVQNNYIKDIRVTRFEKEPQNNIVDINKILLCKRELLPRIKDISFGNFFHGELDELFGNDNFINSIKEISTKYADVELIIKKDDPKFINFKRKILPDLMFELDFNSTPALKTICNKTVAAGYSYNSAIITVYYLVRMIDLFGLEKEKRNVNDLANALKNINNI